MKRIIRYFTIRKRIRESAKKCIVNEANFMRERAMAKDIPTANYWLDIATQESKKKNLLIDLL